VTEDREDKVRDCVETLERLGVAHDERRGLGAEAVEEHLLRCGRLRWEEERPLSCRVDDSRKIEEPGDSSVEVELPFLLSQTQGSNNVEVGKRKEDPHWAASSDCSGIGAADAEEAPLSALGKRRSSEASEGGLGHCRVATPSPSTSSMLPPEPT